MILAATEQSTLLFVGLSIWPIWQSANVGIWLSAVWCRGAEYLHKSLSHHDTETFKHFQYHIPGDTKPACFEYSWLEVRGLGIWKNKEYIKTRQDQTKAPGLPLTWSSPHVAGRGAPWDHSPHQEADTDPGHPCGDKWSLQRHQGHYTHHVQRLECWQERYDGHSHILTEVFLIDDDRDEAQDDTGMTVGVTM